MTHTDRRDDSSDRTPTGRASFAAELEALVARARDAGVDLEGAYDVRSSDGQPEYTVEISEVARRFDRDQVD